MYSIASIVGRIEADSAHAAISTLRHVVNALTAAGEQTAAKLVLEMLLDLDLRRLSK